MKSEDNKIVTTKGLARQFRYQKQSSGFKSWLKPEYVAVDAVKGIDLSILSGEMVAFVGPNGAGKSTTIKMLSGILAPTSGKVTVCGFDPVLQRSALSYQIGCVFGQRSQLLPNLPLRDSLELFGKMYDLNGSQTTKRINELVDIFALNDILGQPVRQLSLGQRMRAEISASLMHSPKLVFLDEPTIGLDVVSKRALRKTLVDLNAQEGTTVFLTSHDTGDIEALAKRTIIIDKGRVIADEPTDNLRKKFLNKKYLAIDFTASLPGVNIPGLELVVNKNRLSTSIDMANQSLNEVLRSLLELGTVQDIHIKDESLEEVILAIYATNKK